MNRRGPYEDIFTTKLVCSPSKNIRYLPIARDHRLLGCGLGLL
jgi:hypothetical protein